MERYDNALADLNHAIELDPKEYWIIAERGETYLSMGRYDDALADLNHAIELDPDDASAIASRGRTYRLMRRYDDALTDIKRAIELDRGLTDTLGAYLAELTSACRAQERSGRGLRMPRSSWW
jgi:tetratricopeptide (TPR) repeat protein